MKRKFTKDEAFFGLIFFLCRIMSKKLKEAESKNVDCQRKNKLLLMSKKYLRRGFASNKGRQDPTICVYCVLILLVIRLNYY
jgi:hypothetical protein